MATTINADPATAIAFAKGVLSHSPPAARDSSLDRTFNCNLTDVNDDVQYGEAYALAYGGLPFPIFTPTATAYALASATDLWGNAYDGACTAYALAYGEILLEGIRKNWVKWSNIGSLDFTIDRSNVAGEMPLDWKGWVYAVKKHRGKAVAYGENGVSILTPAGNAYGLGTISKVGLKGKHAVAGDDSTHFFVDSAGQLWELGEGLSLLDYSEYLSDMSSDIVLSWDEKNSLLYICDGTYGFAYSPKDRSLGSGPINVTGISYQGGTLYVGAPATITSIVPEICTDIYDFGTRKNKTTLSLEFGTNLSGKLQGALDYRSDIRDDFTQTEWYDVNESGILWVTCYGREFRIRARVKEWEYLELDYTTIKVTVHGH